jgi:hypothetical protein
VPSELILTLAVGALRPTPAPRAVIESLIEATVHSGTTGPSGFDLKFAVSTRSPLVTELLPSGYFDPPSRVIVTATLRGAQSVLVDGVITHHEMMPSDEPGKSLLSVKGEDLTRMMDEVDLSGFPFPAIPAEGAIALMLAKYAPLYGVVPLIVPSVLLDVSNPLERINTQRGTDLSYIKYLADLVGYTFYLQPGPTPGFNIAYWGPLLRAPIPFLPAPPPLAIDWDARSNVESLSFSFDGFAATQWIVYIQLEASNAIIPIPVPNVNPISPALGAKQPLPLKIKTMTGMDKYSPTQAAAIALGRAAADANKVVSGQGTLDVRRYGAILNARTLVEVHGAGLTYDGSYFVESVTHTIKPGSYKQSFSLSRNALIADNGPSATGMPLPGFANSAPGPLSNALIPPGSASPPSVPAGPALPTPGLGSTPAATQSQSPGRVVTELPSSPRL